MSNFGSYYPPPAPVFGMINSQENVVNNLVNLEDIFDDFMAPQNNSFGYLQDEDSDDDSADDEINTKGRKKSRAAPDDQKTERRERNREHAKKSRVRKKFLLDSLQQSVQALQEENDKLKSAIREHLGEEAELLLSNSKLSSSSVIASETSQPTRTLDGPDYSLVKALQTAQQNFVISDPALPDNPIVFASQGFLDLTGYKLEQILGRNCRFLQGPETDQSRVAILRSGIEKGEDSTTVMLNYRVDGTTFWNQVFVAALKDAEGNIVNFLGVQCKVSDEYARAFLNNEMKEGSKI